MLILIHTCVLHSYLNMVSELTRFADRDFYHVSCTFVNAHSLSICYTSHILLQDWWTCTSFSEYYRKWNTLVHDWIRAYIYHDFKAVSMHLMESYSYMYYSHYIYQFTTRCLAME